MIEDWISHIEAVAAALSTGFILGKLVADPSTVSIDEISRIDTRFIEPKWSD